VALALIASLAVIALIIDGGYAYAQRRRMQNAADAAAIAGARIHALGGSDTQVDSAVNQYATANGAEGVSWSYLNNQMTVRVTVSHTFSTFFAGIVGLWEMTASATAEASIQPLSAASNLLPMIVEVDDFVIGQTYELWGDDPQASGNFGWLDWNGEPSSSTELADNIANPGNSGYWQVGDWVPASAGVMDSALVRSALEGWIGQHVTIPFYDMVQDSGDHISYRIAGFGEFVLEGFDLQGSDKRVWGHFINWVEPCPGGGPDRGLTTVRLAR